MNPRLAAQLVRYLREGVFHKLHPATLAGPVPRPPGSVRAENEAGELLRALRDDERF
jgi:hypothetical protein